MHWYYGYGAGMIGMLLMTVLAVLLVGGAVALAVLALRRRPDTAERILEERLARGEIDADEFQRVRRTLNA